MSIRTLEVFGYSIGLLFLFLYPNAIGCCTISQDYASSSVVCDNSRSYCLRVEEYNGR